VHIDYNFTDVTAKLAVQCDSQTALKKKKKSYITTITDLSDIVNFFVMGTPIGTGNNSNVFFRSLIQTGVFSYLLLKCWDPYKDRRRRFLGLFFGLFGCI
jgi:hypothetical protein